MKKCVFRQRRNVPMHDLLNICAEYIFTFEYLCCRVTTSGNSYVTVAIYRPGSKAMTEHFFADFTDLLEYLTTRVEPIVIMGDHG